jgi:hypothetical protein
LEGTGALFFGDGLEAALAGTAGLRAAAVLLLEAVLALAGAALRATAALLFVFCACLVLAEVAALDCVAFRAGAFSAFVLLTRGFGREDLAASVRFFVWDDVEE